jgi:hypothetical protein
VANFNRIYLDSNILIASNWPKLSAELENFFDLALLLDVKIVLPEALEIELEEHWIRNLVDVIAITSRPISQLFRMAARHEAPFKEEGSGFQDAIIYLSVIDDLAQGSEHIGALVSQDSIFKTKKDELVGLAKSSSVELNLYHSVQEITEVLRTRLRTEMIKDWEDRNRLVANALNRRLKEIERFVSENLEISEAEFGLGVKLVEFKGFRIKEMTNIQTPVIRKPDEPEKISFDLELEIDVAAEKRLIPAVPPAPRVRVGEKTPPPGPVRFGDIFAPPTVEEQKIPWMVEVEAVVPANDPEYKNIELSSILSKGTGATELGFGPLKRRLLGLN